MRSLSVMVGRIGIYIGLIGLVSYALLTLMLWGLNVGEHPNTGIMFLGFSIPFIILLIGYKGLNLLSQEEKKGLQFIFLSSVLLAIPTIIAQYLSRYGSPIESPILYNPVFSTLLYPYLVTPLPALFLFISGLIGTFRR